MVLLNSFTACLVCLAVSGRVVPVPAYIDYARAAGLAGLPVTMLPLLADEDFQLDQARLASLLQPGDLVILGRPNNPNGRLPEGDALLALAKAYPGCTFLIDEAFLEFAGSNLSLAGRAENILTLHSMTKFYAIPGLRLGYAVLTAELAERWQSQAAPWTVNHLAQAVGCRALADTSYQEQSRQRCQQLRTELSAALTDFPQLQSFSACANYLLLRLACGTARELADKLLAAGILIRCCNNYPGLDERYFRVAVRTERENGLLLEALASALPPGTTRKRTVSTRRTPAIMLQGTSSNAGKSVLTTALCRILLQDGVRVAPFKAQNMSLNSYVTRDGGEMGRAQVVQAQAARLDPDVRMNPVLLKPSSDVGCQIIVEGQPLQSMNVDQYALYKQLAWPKVTACYDSLSADYEAVVLEGAGSPGEVNLKQNDIVNMRMAAYAQAPVLLVGDIDRGGVYASFIGTMEVLDSWERQLLAGFIVNRFRGQADLLESAHQYVYRHTGKPVLGVVPYLPQLGLPEEDSVSFKAGLYDRAAPGQDHVRIGVVDLPHISNFTDIEPFLAEPDVHLLICRHPEEAAGADALILPGSKNVPADLRYLHDSGFAACIRQLAADGTEIVGICGGYQMLGRQILDPLHLESLADSACPGIALLDMNTELLAEKTLRLKKGLHLVANQPVSGYEIHHGVSVGDVREILRFEDGTTCGARHPLLPVWGSYLHGIFDSDPFRRWFIDGLRHRKGLTPIGQICAPYDLEAAFDRLAETVRKSLDMPHIYSLLRL